MSGLETRSALLGKRSRRYLEVDITGLGPVRIQSLSERERAELEVKAMSDTSQFRANLIALTLVDEDGARLFADSDVDSILEVDSSLTGELAAHINEHCEVPRTEESVKN